MLATTLILGMTISDWGMLTGLMVSVGTILFFVKKMFVKWISDDIKQDIKDIKSEVTPNGRDTQKVGDIAARTETKVDNLYSFMERYAEKTDNIEKDLAYLKGAFQTHIDNNNVKSL
jgi:septal ring factor EnvC (AmiA/AmiB activator)